MSLQKNSPEVKGQTISKQVPKNPPTNIKAKQPSFPKMESNKYAVGEIFHEEEENSDDEEELPLNKKKNSI